MREQRLDRSPGRVVFQVFAVQQRYRRDVTCQPDAEPGDQSDSTRLPRPSPRQPGLGSR